MQSDPTILPMYATRLGYGERPVCFKRRVFDSVLNVFQTVSITQRPNLGV